MNFTYHCLRELESGQVHDELIFGVKSQATQSAKCKAERFFKAP